jgi:hypothetical protein
LCGAINGRELLGGALGFNTICTYDTQLPVR